jgi:tRNA(His) guanylyltransferase
MKDDLGDRIKNQYENRTRFYLPRRTYTIIRIDGKAFHTYTKHLKKPFDLDLCQDINDAVIEMMPQIQGVQFAYTQSDEISLLLTDFALPTTSAWFDGNIQKMVSIASSIMTAEFNQLRIKRNLRGGDVEGCKNVVMLTPLAYFDARAFTIPDRIEVINYFIHRNQDCSRNSISMIAQSEFSHKELQGKSTQEMQEMLMIQKNIDWSTYNEALKNGRLIVKEEYYPTVSEMNDFEFYGTSQTNPPAKRTRWIAKPAWKFTQDKDKLLNMIPKYE